MRNSANYSTGRVKQSRNYREASMAPPVYFCDKCGGMLSTSCYQQVSSLCLCHDCSNHYDTIPNGMLKQSLTRFMMGNVV